ncbi:acetylglutamate kinase [Melioribacter sp. OK-6-Me]|uniref:acetylglutamate kinase n=1 Tax=unclassified Melioribacter TaxID=2627329 RepID=UPI003EDA719D
MTLPKYRKEDVLVEALPYIQEFENKTFVVKYGGAVMEEENLKQMVAQDVTLLRKIGINIIVVHGGGKEITSLSNKLNIKTNFINGQRYTDQDTIGVVQMVLAGQINKDIVRRINMHGGRAVGISGIDGNLLGVKKYEKEDLGLVGEIENVNDRLLSNLMKDGYMPVIAPVGVDSRGTIYNVNADIAACYIAGAVTSSKLVFLTDVEGIKDGDRLLTHLTRSEAQNMIEDGIISGGMIPKVESAFRALEAGVKKVHIIDGRIPHALLLEIFTKEGVGTEIVDE